jgi:hypothetical protein
VHAQPDCRPGNATFSQHGVKDPDQMKVYLVEKGKVSHTGALICAIC